ncbi:MAG: hypothetical protein R3F16_07655 [Myxococcota bacterium]|nr:hypothetical protein [Myxococcales bacterium]
MNLDQSTQVLDVFGFLRRRGKLAAIVAGGVILAMYWIAMALPNLYTSAAVIMVEPQSIDEALVDSGVREVELNERLSLMTSEILSRSRLSDIIDRFGLYPEDHKDMQRFEIVEMMRDFIRVEPVLNELSEGQRRNRELRFNTFRIVFRHEDPIVARDVAQAIANDFINANIKDRTEVTGKSLEFMRDEIESLSGELTSVEKSIAGVKAENAGRLPEEIDSNQRMLQFAMSDLRDAQRVFDTAQSDAAFWRNQALTASELSSPNDTTSPTYRLKQLELGRAAMVAKGFTNKHPDVVQLEAEISALRESLNSASEDGAAGPSSASEQQALAEQGRAELRAKAAAEDIERLRATVADFEARLAATPAVAERLDALSRRYDHLYRSYQDFSNRLQQAGVQADLERRQLGERFRILEPAERAPEPSSPNRILLLTLGAILGIVLGVGIGLVSELTDSSMHTSSDLQSALGIPVLASVPRIVLESDRAARSRRIMHEAVAAFAVVFVVLVGGLVTYYFVNAQPDRAVAEQEGAAEAQARVAPRTGRG